MSAPGEVHVVIDGEPRLLRLTLGALAEIEQSVGDGDFDTLRERLQRPSAGDLLLILHALIAGGGAPLALDLLRASDIDFRAAAKAIGEAFKGLGNGRSAMGDGDAESVQRSGVTSQGRGERPSTDAPPPKPRARRSPGRRGSAPESSQ